MKIQLAEERYSITLKRFIEAQKIQRVCLMKFCYDNNILYLGMKKWLETNDREFYSRLFPKNGTSKKIKKTSDLFIQVIPESSPNHVALPLTLQSACNTKLTSLKKYKAAIVSFIKSIKK